MKGMPKAEKSLNSICIVVAFLLPNAQGFKFSWSLRGALLSQRNTARYLKNGKIEQISSDALMATAAPYHVIDGYDIMAYPNAIPEAHTVFCGSPRYKGSPSFMWALDDIGWLDQTKKTWLKDGMGWAAIHQHMLGASSSYMLSMKCKEGYLVDSY